MDENAIKFIQFVEGWRQEAAVTIISKERRFFEAQPSCKHFLLLLLSSAILVKNVFYCNISLVSFASPFQSSPFKSYQILSNLAKSCLIL